jgi:hypothetical protein
MQPLLKLMLMLMLLPLPPVLPQAHNVVAPRRRGMIGSLAAASDGPRQPIPDTVWVTATTGGLPPHLNLHRPV